jgi:hypothetical protein
LRQLQALEQAAAAQPEEVGDGAGDAVGEQDGVHAVLEAGAVTDQVQAEPRALARLADVRLRQPDRGHQVAPAELGQDARVDAVGLAGQRCQPLDARSVGDLDLPAGELELVVDKAGARH